jgi:ADP-ribose pyrophosphatase
MPKAQRWTELKRATVYHKYSQTVERRDYRQPNGKVLDYYIHVEVPGVCMLAFTEDDKIITMPQYRPGPDAILREIPGGRVDPGEAPADTAIRELLEETGYAGELQDWSSTWQADAYSQINRTVVILKNCRKVAEPRLEDTEFGEVELVEIADFVAEVRTGRLTDTAGALLALDHLGLLK